MPVHWTPFCEIRFIASRFSEYRLIERRFIKRRLSTIYSILRLHQSRFIERRLMEHLLRLTEGMQGTVVTLVT